MITNDNQLLAAFTPEWERLGAVAARLGLRHGNMIAKRAQGLREQGLVESKFNGVCLSWRLAEPVDLPPEDSLSLPPKLSPYCPPVELEGPHSGLVEQLAQRLWRKVRDCSAKPEAAGLEWEGRPEHVKAVWREVAHDALLMLFDIGFVGPAGEPKADRFEGLSYCWNYLASEWQVNDADGGYVALVRETPDLEVMLAAPGMRSAIRALLEPLPANHPLRANPQIAALEAALPENSFKRGGSQCDRLIMQSCWPLRPS
jgi:hypothetical protein